MKIKSFRRFLVKEVEMKCGHLIKEKELERHLFECVYWTKERVSEALEKALNKEKGKDK